MIELKRRIHSFVWSGIAALLAIAMAIYSFVETKDTANLFFWLIVGTMFFTFISCLILHNNFIGDMCMEIFSWGFVTMPGLIFTLDLDGILWLLTVKLLFWILGILLAIICALLAILVGMVVSIFVYPFAIYKNIKYLNASEN